ncbi:MAG TPA: phytoene/squalene synthase family protein [Planctomycetota bacterium]|nr:phytoene/squalene synthase family protein [Planctomycetota bacterium]
MIELDRAWARCHEIVRARAKNFAYAFIFLPEEKRRALDAVYAFCRIADDHADEESRPLDERRRRLESLRARLHRTLPREGDAKGEVVADPDEDLVLLAVGESAKRFGVSRDDLELVIDGCIQDLTVARYATWTDLRDYCFKVASAVGLACLEVFGHEGDAREPGIDLGLAMQLTNIVRDVTEDSARGRIYLPLEDLARFGVSERALLAGERTPETRALLAFEGRRARELFASAERLYTLIPDRRARACPRTLAALYLALLDEIERRDFDVFGARASLRGTTKLRLALGGIVRSFVG